MTSSGTYTFSLSNTEIVLAAYERIQIRNPSLRAEHFSSARRELNVMLAQFSNLQPNLWKVELESTLMVQGTATYTVNPKVVMILDAYISLNNATTSQTDTYITPLSRTQYASIGNKEVQGRPTQYWFDRLIAPTVTMWPIPDNGGPYELNYYACLQVQDANLTGGETPDVPYIWLDALVAGLSHRLARVYAPQLEQVRKMDAQEAWSNAATQNVENTPFSIAPDLGAYYRRR
jgi:hypothetical protein